MKKVCFLALIMAIIMFYSCETETVEVNESNEVSQEMATSLNIQNYLCYYRRPIMGTRINDNLCFPNAKGNDICGFESGCDFTGVFDSGDFCILQPCEPDLSFPEGFPDIFDPLVVPEIINPLSIRSIKDNLKLDIKSNEVVMPFALNENLAGLQFYEAADLFKDDIYLVRNTLTLDIKISKKLGLRGNVVKPGKYPVLINKKNGTYNVILSVEKGFK